MHVQTVDTRLSLSQPTGYEAKRGGTFIEQQLWTLPRPTELQVTHSQQEWSEQNYATTPLPCLATLNLHPHQYQVRAVQVEFLPPLLHLLHFPPERWFVVVLCTGAENLTCVHKNQLHILPEGVCSCGGTKTESGINWDLCGLKRLQSKSSHKSSVSCKKIVTVVIRQPQL